MPAVRAMAWMAAYVALHAGSAAAELVYVSEWGSLGSGVGQFRYPTGITLAPNGDLYVADGGNSRVCRYTTDGQHVMSFGSHGTAPGMFRTPHHLRFSPVNGDLYVTDKQNHRIQRFTADGTFVQAWGSLGTGPGQFDTPWGIHVDASGSVWVACRYQQRVQIFTEDGTYVTEWGLDGTGPGEFRAPHVILSDDAGNVYVSDVVRHDVQKFDASLNYLLQWGGFGSLPGQFLHPHDLTLVDGEMVVLDWLEHPHGGRLTSFTTSGVLVDVLVSSSQGTGAGEFNSISDTAYDGSGTWFITDWGNHRIQKLRPSAVGVEDPTRTEGPVPALGLPFPNPSRGAFRVNLGPVPVSDTAYELALFDVSGQRVLSRPLASPLPPRYELDWATIEGGHSPAGVYFVTLRGEGLRESRRVVRVR